MNAKRCKKLRRLAGFKPSEQSDRTYTPTTAGGFTIEHLGMKPPYGYCVKAYETEQVGLDGVRRPTLKPYLAPRTWVNDPTTPRAIYRDAKRRASA
jgi:hypothetical protein